MVVPRKALFALVSGGCGLERQFLEDHRWIRFSSPELNDAALRQNSWSALVKVMPYLGGLRLNIFCLSI